MKMTEMRNPESLWISRGKYVKLFVQVVSFLCIARKDYIILHNESDWPWLQKDYVSSIIG